MCLTKRPVTQKYLFEINADCKIQLGIEVNDQKIISHIIKKMNQTIIGLHLKLDNDFISYTKSESPIFKLPNNFRNLQQTSEFFNETIKVDPRTRLGCIGYNDKSVIINISHAVGDGGYFKYIIENLNEKEPSKVPNFPNEAHQIFEKEIRNSPNSVTNWSNQTQVNRVCSNILKNNEIKNNSLKKIPAKYITIRIPGNQLICFKDGKIRGLTESLWTSLYLSSINHNQKFIDHISMPTCVDLRRYLHNKDIDYSICNCFSNVTPFSPVSLNDSLKSVGERMKNNMFQLMKEGRDFGVLKVYDNIQTNNRNGKNNKQDSSNKNYENDKNINVNENNCNGNNKTTLNNIEGCGIELTYVGPIIIKKPIVDLWVGHSMNVRSSTISLMGFGIKDDYYRNEVVFRLRYPPNYFTDNEAEIMAHSIQYCLKNIPGERKVGEALKNLHQFSNTKI